MRKLLHITILLLFPLIILAQIPNSGFEAWTNMGTYDNPDQWSSLNDLTAISGIFTCEKGTPGYPGASYIKITSRDISGVGIVQGMVVSGILNTTSLQPVSGFPYTGRPEYLQGNWQFMAFGADQGYISVFLSKWNNATHFRDTIAYVFIPLDGMQMSWREFNLPLTYYSGSTPDSAIIVASASNANGAVIADNSYLWLDNLLFTGTVEGIPDITKDNPFGVYPNPARETITISFRKTLVNPVYIDIVNTLGQEVISMKMDSYIHSFPVNISHLPSGIYTVKVTSAAESSSSRFVHEK
jgi:hypothetical protein